jgi:hypothetical protein
MVGLYFQKRNPNNQILPSIVSPPPTDSPSVLTGNNPTVAPEGADFDNERREVDRNPGAMATKLAAQNPLTGNDPTRAYLYGRALLLTGRYAEATTAFKRSGELLATRQGLESMKVDNALSALAAATKANNEEAKRLALDDLERAVRQASAPPSATPTGAAPAGVNPGSPQQ